MRYILTILLLLTSSIFATALKVDNSLVHKKLSNGLQYYILKHNNPTKALNLTLYVKVGSQDENSNQLGYAHIVEHMVFEGSKNLPSKKLDKFLKSIGQTIGDDVNAFTKDTSTCYKLNLPTNETTTVKQAFFTLKEWAFEANYDKVSFQKEKKIILEEYRSKYLKQIKIQDDMLKALYDNDYKIHPIIGTEQSIKDAKLEEVKKFYKNYYQPKNMVLVVVGDIKPKEIEKYIKQYFLNYKNTPTTKEQKHNLLKQTSKKITYAKDINPFDLDITYGMNSTKINSLKTRDDLKQHITYDILNSLVKNRLGRYNLKHILNILYNTQTMYPNNYVFQLTSVAKKGKNTQAIKELIAIYKSLHFTKKEFEDAIKAYDTKLSKQSMVSLFADDIVDNIIDLIASNSVVWKADSYLNSYLAKKQLHKITLKEVNTLAKSVFDANRQFFYISLIKQTDKKLFAKDIQNIIKTTKEAKVIKEIIKKEHLKTVKPSLKKVLQKNLTQLTYANGIKVLLYKHHKNNSYTGAIQKQDAVFVHTNSKYNFINNLMNISFNIAPFKTISQTEFNSITQAYTLNYNYDDGVEISGGNDSVAYALKILYDRLNYRLVDEKTFNHFKALLKSMLYTKNNGLYLLAKSYDALADFDKKLIPSLKEYEKYSYKEYKRYLENYFSPKNYVVVVSTDDKDVEKYLDKYIGNIKTTTTKKSIKPLDFKNKDASYYQKGFEKGKTSITLKFYKEVDDKLKYKHINMLGEYLYNLLSKELREKDKDLYGIDEYMDFKKLNKKYVVTTIKFICKSTKKDKIISHIKDIVKNLHTTTITKQDMNYLQKTFKNYNKEKKSQLARSYYNMLRLYVQGIKENIPAKLLYDYDCITAKELKSVAKDVFDEAYYVELIYDESK